VRGACGSAEARAKLHARRRSMRRELAGDVDGECDDDLVAAAALLRCAASVA
jgi:hypothetical protein